MDAVAEDRLGDLRRRGDLVGVLHAELVREHRDAEEEHAQDDGHPHERGGGVLGLRLLEGGDAVGDRLDAGERGGARREGAEDEEPAHAGGAGLVPTYDGSAAVQIGVDEQPDEPDRREARRMR